MAAVNLHSGDSNLATAEAAAAEAGKRTEHPVHDIVRSLPLYSSAPAIAHPLRGEPTSPPTLPSIDQTPRKRAA